ncbi:ANGEL1 [Cordylochernes scorpioides]|uniref:ANGEL1 n=1 Tax=Cordylochernes scorpioides TaxID=51811 RepID=A0ABY6LNS6_9ARAC|nr:ANGEL1 [Cordylochernes scorpioides]
MVETRSDPNWQVYDGRGWQLTPSGNQHLQRPLPGLEFSLMSYNVLSQHLMVDHPHLYQQCPPSALDWTQRGQALLAQIHSNSPDVSTAALLLLFEVDETHYNEFFLPQLVQMGHENHALIGDLQLTVLVLAGYQCSYKKRTRSKKDGCALIFKSDKFELENLVNVEFYKDEVNLLGRDNVGMIGVLRHKHMLGKQSRLLVATTHLLFNPARGDIKLAQLLVLLAEIHQLALKSPGGSNYHPVLLCGDFNSEPLSPLYKFISSGNLALDDLKCSEISGQSKFPWKGKPLQKDQLINKDIGISLNSRYENNQGPSQTLLKACQDSDEPIPPLEQNVLKHNFKFVSAYNHMDSLGQPEISTYHANAACTVDYIFYSVAERTTQYQYGRPILSHLQPGELTHLASYSLPSQTQLQPQGTLPNLIHPSDHLPLISRFIWNPTS